LGDPLADGVGEVCAVPVPGRVARKIPIPPSRINSTNAMAAGTSQRGRSLGSRSSGRATDGCLAGARGTAVEAAMASAAAAVGTGSVIAGASPGVQAGLAIGVHVCCGAAGAGVGPAVGGELSNADAAAGGS
jgi:hypothetical protein